MRAGSILTVTVLFPGALGDLVLVLPTLRHLRRRHRDLRMVVAVDRRYAPLVRIAGVADEVAPVDGPEVARMLGGGPAPGWWGRTIQCHAWMGAGDPALRRVLARHTEGLTVARVVRDDGRAHAGLEYAAAVGWEATWPDLVAGTRLEVAPLRRRDGVRLGRDVLIVHRGAGTPGKRWSPEGFLHVAAWWRRRGGTVVDLCGPADAGLPPLPGATTLAPEVADLPGVLAAAGAFVGGDSGPAHVAGAVGAAGVVVFGPTRAARWRPAAPRLVAVGAGPARRADAGGVHPHAVVDALHASLCARDAERS